MERIKLLIFTNHFFPENFRVNDVAFDLVKLGYDVHVVTCIPNYPAGKFYKGYHFFKKNSETINGVKISRLPLVPRGKGSQLRLFINYISYLISTCFYSLWLVITKKYDIVLIHETSPVTIALPGIIYSRLRNCKMIMWVLDLWPESISAASSIKSKRVYNLLNRLVKFIYARSYKILISSKGFTQSIIAKGVTNEKLEYFPNWAEDVYLKMTQNKELINQLSKNIPSTGLRIMYTGNIGEAQDLDNILRNAVTFKNDEIYWIFVGSGRKLEYLKLMTDQGGLNGKVFFLGNHPIELMPAFFSLADVMLLALKKEPIFELTVPAKLQAYMCFGKPILGVISGEASQIIKEARCGFTCEPGNLKSFRSCIEKLMSQKKEVLLELGKNASEYYNQNFSKDANLKKLDLILKEAVYN